MKAALIGVFGIVVLLQATDAYSFQVAATEAVGQPDAFADRDERLRLVDEYERYVYRVFDRGSGEQNEGLSWIADYERADLRSIRSGDTSNLPSIADIRDKIAKLKERDAQLQAESEQSATDRTMVIEYDEMAGRGTIYRKIWDDKSDHYMRPARYLFAESRLNPNGKHQATLMFVYSEVFTKYPEVAGERPTAYRDTGQMVLVSYKDESGETVRKEFYNSLSNSSLADLELFAKADDTKIALYLGTTKRIAGPVTLGAEERNAIIELVERARELTSD